MPVKYQDYKILSEESSYNLQRKVNELLQKGWVPIGGVSATTFETRYVPVKQYSQAVALPL